MSLADRINTDMKEAMKAKDKESLQALRAVKSAILLANTEAGAGELSETDEIKMLQKLVKQRRDSAQIYKDQGRDELFQQESFEADVIARYLPEQMSEAEMEDVIKGIIDKLGANSMKDMGKVMGVASKELAGKADGKAISAKVKALLA